MASERSAGPAPAGHGSGGTAARRLRLGAYSLWLLPSGTARRRLARLIRRLARRCATAPFEPHLTLLGGITLPRHRAVERTRELARVLPPFPLRLEGAGQSETFFRCLFLRAAGAGLRRARARALRMFPSGPGSRGTRVKRGRFRPHLSLVYGRLPIAVRRQLALAIGGTTPLTFTARQIALVRTSGDHSSWRSIEVCRLEDRSNVARRRARTRRANRRPSDGAPSRAVQRDGRSEAT
jgi:2'-5' RNA ligase